MSSPLKGKLLSNDKLIDEGFHKHKTDDKELIKPIVEKASTSMQKEETTVATRLEIIRKLEEGVTIGKLVAQYGLHKRTIERYKRNILSLRKISKNPRRLVMKRTRASLHEDTNVRLLEWILERQMKGDILRDSMLQTKAMELHEQFGCSTPFTASRGWLWRFKKRYNISGFGCQGTANEIAQLTTETLTKILNEENINRENIYNIYETTLMWRILPQEVSSNEEESSQNEKIKKDHIIIAFCVNATGTHKLPPLFVTKYVIPQSLKLSRHMLPIVYRSQNSSFIDETIFTDWYANHFKPNVKQRQQQEHCIEKVLLFVENFKCDISLKKEHQDSHFKIIIFPSNTPSTIQIMDEGIIANFKKLFREKLHYRQIRQHDNEVKKFYTNYDIKECIDLISETWDEIIVTDIVHSWRRLLGKQNTQIIIKEEVEYLEETQDFEENVVSDKILESVVKCEEEESTITTKEEIDRMFRSLEIWTKTQPDFIKSHAEVLIHYHNQQ
ncbi:tigger transposable element-derived protein 2-like [Bombus huntii]|uniref:tigger transposable element-derived protein 2-like n=1 Tax=Bombus huntii TaxID=85661 RepID=UPI0021A9C10D|nr:tigger transposable element-derived protein 2-like [Bombus huntii]